MIDIDIMCISSIISSSCVTCTIMYYNYKVYDKKSEILRAHVSVNLSVPVSTVRTIILTTIDSFVVGLLQCQYPSSFYMYNLYSHETNFNELNRRIITCNYNYYMYVIIN